MRRYLENSDQLYLSGDQANGYLSTVINISECLLGECLGRQNILASCQFFYLILTKIQRGKNYPIPSTDKETEVHKSDFPSHKAMK